MKIHTAFSLRNGIAIYSISKPGWVYIATDSGTGTKLIEVSELNNILHKSFGSDSNYLHSTIYLILIAFALVLSAITGEFKNFFEYILLIPALVSLFTFLKNCFQERKFDTLKFHSAEHMIVNYLNIHNEIPTVAELKKYSRFCNNCGSNDVAHKVLCFILLYLALHLFGFICSIVAIIPIIWLVSTMCRNGWLNFIQIFSTQKPTEKELSVAIKCVQFMQENEDEHT